MASKNPFQRKDKETGKPFGPWIGYVELPKDDRTGKRSRKWFRNERQDFVKREMNAYKAKIEAGNWKEPKKIKLENYLDDWIRIDCATKQATTVEGYKSHIEKHIKPFLGHMLIGKILPKHIQEFYNKQYKDGHNLKQEHAILRKAFNDAIKNELINKNPCQFITIPEQKEFTATIYTEKQYNTLLEKIKNTKDELPVILGGMCGLRRSEIMGLRWCDIDLDNNIINIRQAAVVADNKVVIKKPKNKTSFRSFAFPSEINSILKRHQGIGEALVFPKIDGTVENGGNYSKRFKYLLEKYELPHIRLHDLRHFTATMYLKNKVDPKIGSEMMGYSTPQIYQKTYQHVSNEMQKETAEKMNSILISPEKKRKTYRLKII